MIPHRRSALMILALLLAACAPSRAGDRSAASDQKTAPEVRGTWVTTTANTHIQTPENTAETMRRFREIGLNTVYVETWKNGYTQYPSKVLESVIGVDRRPNLMPQDPADTPEVLAAPARDLLQETLIEAHRNQLAYIAWFEYGFMAAHQSTDNHLLRMKPEWLSRDIDGNTIAPNGFHWMNPLHPGPRRFLLDIVLEAIDKYDLDGVQLDDRIVWPYITMGYDDYTREVYASEHDGRQPPEDHTDPEWMAWRWKKINEYGHRFVEEIRAARPGIIVSLSPAPYPWVYEHYMLNWPQWAAEGLWDEYIPQCYRYDWPAFKNTWDQQLNELAKAGGRADPSLMLAGILTTGSKPDPVPWADLKQEIDYVRQTGGGGHVWWFSRGVLDEYPGEISSFYSVETSGRAPHPRLPAGWRPAPVILKQDAGAWTGSAEPGAYRVIARRPGGHWERIDTIRVPPSGELRIDPAAEYEAVELLRDRRPENSQPR